MNKIVLLISKDCMPLEVLPCYSSIGAANYWRGKTPNIDELARKGTMFMRHYTAAPSTSMSMSAMLTGHYPYEFKKRKDYVNVSPSEFPSIFDEFQSDGYECHLIWDETWMYYAWRYVREFGDERLTIIHNLDIAQPAGGQKKMKDKNLRDDALLSKTTSLIYDTLNKIDLSKKQFIWLHLPHILKGRRSYQDDMDVFDDIVGYCRKLVGDENIFLSTDHGHMNLHKHKVCYGFDLYEPNVHIPLITPRIDGLKEVKTITSNIDLPQILKGIIPFHDYVVSDTKYYAQPHRRISIIDQRFKLIYNAKDNKEELYDLEWDPMENYNILESTFYDSDRSRTSILDEIYFYPYHTIAMKEYDYLKKVKNKIWKDGTFLEILYCRFTRAYKRIKGKFHI